MSALKAKFNFHQDYQLGQQIGTGASSRVHTATKIGSGGNKVAVKIIDLSKIPKDMHYYICSEIEILNDIDHPNIVKLLELYQDENTLFLVFEHLKGGDISNALYKKFKFSEQEAAKALKGVVDALVHCHNNGVVHRDIKLENIFYNTIGSNSTVKLGDFGLAYKKPCDQNEKSAMTTVCGTLGYTAPEIILQQQYKKEVDCWSMGVVLYHLLSGKAPFSSNDMHGEEEVKQKILSGSFSFDGPDWADISEDAKELIRGLLVVNPNQRMTSEELANHIWFDKNC